MAVFNLHILPSLSKNNAPSAGMFFCTRKLNGREIDVIRSKGLLRYFLKPLSFADEQKFFQDFDAFWNKVICDKSPGDPFWRNSVSSKMQEWENSVGYLALALFSMKQDPQTQNIELTVLPDNVEEAFLWKTWADANGWRVVRFQYYAWNSILQISEHTLRMVRLSILFFLKKFRTKTVFPNVKPGAFLVATMFYRRSLECVEYEDQFFGCVHKDIAAQGRDTLYVGDAIDALKQHDYQVMGQRGFPLSLYSLLSWKDFVDGLWALWAGRLTFEQCLFGSVDFSRALQWYGRRARYEINWSAEFFYRAISRACRLWQFDKMLYVFEGNVYERACIQAVRAQCPMPIDAYSHAVIYRLNLKLRLSPGEQDRCPEPNRYLLCGYGAKEAFKQIRRAKAPVVDVCFLGALTSKIDGPRHNRTVIVAALDGVWSTANVVDWLCLHKDIFEGHELIIRPHPNVSGKRLISQCPQFQQGAFEISSRPLLEDLRRASCVLYRQSSVAVTALLNGIPVIHLNIDMPLCGDPLPGTHAGKSSVSSAQELMAAVARLGDLQAQLDDNQDNRAVYARSYFNLPSEELIQPFLEAYA